MMEGFGPVDDEYIDPRPCDSKEESDVIRTEYSDNCIMLYDDIVMSFRNRLSKHKDNSPVVEKLVEDIFQDIEQSIAKSHTSKDNVRTGEEGDW